MYAVIRKFNKMRSIEEAGRRAETGLVPLLRQSPGFRGYYVVKGGDEMIVSITFFETEQAVQEAHRRAMDWVRDNLGDLIEGQPEVVAGEVVIDVPVHSEIAM